MGLLGGEARFRQLYCRAGAVDDVLAAWREVVGERAEVLTRDEALGRGWFGSWSRRCGPRIGDVLVACRDDFSVMSSRAFPYEATLVGHARLADPGGDAGPGAGGLNPAAGAGVALA